MTEDITQDSLQLRINKKAGETECDFEMTASSPRAAVHGIALAVTYIAEELQMAPQDVYSVVAAVLFNRTDGTACAER